MHIDGQEKKRREGDGTSLNVDTSAPTVGGRGYQALQMTGRHDNHEMRLRPSRGWVATDKKRR